MGGGPGTTGVARRRGPIQGLAAALAAAAVGGVGLAAWPYTVDDAFVLARYARRIVAGLGYTMNDGPPTDGVTGPLGLVPAMLGELLFGDPVLASKVAGLGCAALAAFVAVWAARQTREAWVTAALVGCVPWLGIWGVAGLETGMATLAVTVAGVVVFRGRDSAIVSAVAVGAAVASLAWLRPELAPAALVLLVLFTRRAPRGAAAVAWTLAVAGAVSIVAFRVALFDSPIPLSARAKPSDLAHGAEYVARGVLLVFGLGVVPVILAAREDGRRRGLSLVLVAHVAAVLLAGGDWMPGFRLFAPVVPLYALVAAGPIAAKLPRGAHRWMGALLLGGAVAIPLVAGGLALPEARAAGDARDTAGAELAGWLSERGGPVALVDVGFLGFRTGLEVVDLGGITDPRIGDLPGGHAAKAIDPATLAAREPRFIVLHAVTPPRVREGRLIGLAGHPVERRVAGFGWTQQAYRVARVVRYAPGYWYVVLARR